MRAEWWWDFEVAKSVESFRAEENGMDVLSTSDLELCVLVFRRALGRM